jgi:small subunit ribosomal protein S18
MADDRQESGGREEGGERPRRRFGGGGGGRSFPRRKVCAFCVDGIKHIDYKDVPRIRRSVSDRGMIEPRRKTGVCAKHQRSLAIAIKRARHLALLSFTEGMREPRERGRFGDRGGRFGDRGGRFGDRPPRFGDREGGERPPRFGDRDGGERPAGRFGDRDARPADRDQPAAGGGSDAPASSSSAD